MRWILYEIQSGKLPRNGSLKTRLTDPHTVPFLLPIKEHPIEKVGKELRAMMPWLKNKPRVRSELFDTFLRLCMYF